MNPLANAPLMQGIQLNLHKSKVLSTLHLISIHISKDGWSHLAKGIGQSKSLKRLLVNKCPLNGSSLEILASGIGKNESI